MCLIKCINWYLERVYDCIAVVSPIALSALPMMYLSALNCKLIRTFRQLLESVKIEVLNEVMGRPQHAHIFFFWLSQPQLILKQQLLRWPRKIANYLAYHVASGGNLINLVCTFVSWFGQAINSKVTSTFASCNYFIMWLMMYSGVPRKLSGRKAFCRLHCLSGRALFQRAEGWSKAGRTEASSLSLWLPSSCKLCDGRQEVERQKKYWHIKSFFNEWN